MASRHALVRAIVWRGVLATAAGVPAAVMAGQVPTDPPPLPGLPAASSSQDQSDASSRRRVETPRARREASEDRLLEVGVQIFGPRAVQIDGQRSVGLSPAIPRSEGRFIALHLAKTLESMSRWGAVRVVPAPGEGIELFVVGKILESNGKRLALDVEVVDSSGRHWLHRTYEGEADRSAYRPERVGRQEAFQQVYDRIASDLLAARGKLRAGELVSLRRLATLRFARALSPETFAPYLKVRSGRYSARRLPAEGDPMLKRVSRIRERDQMLLDTLNGHYLTFYERMTGPYAGWRLSTYEEQEALDRVKRESRLKKVLGGAAVVAGLLIDANSRNGSVIGDVAIQGGAMAVEAGFLQAQEARVHEAALQELANSFDDEVTPLLVEVEGRQLELTGSAEAQFASWREGLRHVVLEKALARDPTPQP